MADYFINEGNKIGYMPTEFGETGDLIEKTIKAGTDLAKGKLVAVTDDLVVSTADADSTSVIGVSMFDVKQGDPIAVETEGLFKLVAGAPIIAGAKVQSDANGDVITATTGQVVGYALSSAGTGEPVFIKFTL